MNQDERRVWLIKRLLDERGEWDHVRMPVDADGQRELLRALFNIRPPQPIDQEFLSIQDAYLGERIRERGIRQVSELEPPRGTADGERIVLWRGDITTLAVDAIVNAANSQLLGCFVPGHHCIDNAIHTFAGVQLRLECARIMREQGHEEPTGQAKITPGFNLPAKHVVHTVGPIVYGRTPSARDELLLRSSYRSCLEVADQAGCESLALCCVSTGVFHYPNELAARVALDEVRAYVSEARSNLLVVFNVFLEQDEHIYQKLLAQT